jgi:hypothetical protein
MICSVRVFKKTLFFLLKTFEIPSTYRHIDSNIIRKGYNITIFYLPQNPVPVVMLLNTNGVTLSAGAKLKKTQQQRRRKKKTQFAKERISQRVKVILNGPLGPVYIEDKSGSTSSGQLSPTQRWKIENRNKEMEF